MDKMNVDRIVKFIKTLYKPNDIVVSLLYHTDSDGVKKPEYYIYVYFDYIDDKYISNPHFRNSVHNKETFLKTEIMKYIQSFFSYEISGASRYGFNPFEYKGLTIEVKSNEEEESPPFPEA